MQNVTFVYKINDSPEGLSLCLYRRRSSVVFLIVSLDRLSRCRRTIYDLIRDVNPGDRSNESNQNRHKIRRYITDLEDCPYADSGEQDGQQDQRTDPRLVDRHPV